MIEVDENYVELFSKQTVSEFLKTLKKIANETIDKYIKSKNIETYKDMKIIKKTEVKQDNTILYYLYDVEDRDVDELYENIKSHTSEELNVGDLVRVYVSGVIYIGFKI